MSSGNGHVEGVPKTATTVSLQVEEYDDKSTTFYLAIVGPLNRLFVVLNVTFPFLEIYFSNRGCFHGNGQILNLNTR